MTALFRYTSVSAAALVLAGCGDLGKVEQGRVIAYDKQTKSITLIREADSGPGDLPPVTVAAPIDPSEMGPAPSAGGLMRLDFKNNSMLVYDRKAQAFKTVPYTALKVVRDVAKSPGPPVVDRAKKTITFYAPGEHAVITFGASDDLLAMPADTWRTGDVVRYYYKDPAQALRLMNVTKTDLSKSG